jgi:hypothetical protein
MSLSPLHRSRSGPLSGLLAFCLLASAPAWAALTPQEVSQLLEKIDAAQSRGGNIKAVFTLVQKEKDKPDVAREGVMYGREEKDDLKLVILFTRPKTEQGAGYLRLDNNLWSYDPRVGRWERRTDRDRIAGTDSVREDYDAPSYAKRYDATYEGEAEVGSLKTHKLLLKAKEGATVTFPMKRLWVDQKTLNVIMGEDYALSGRLMRTAYYPKWQKGYSETKKGDVWFPQQMLFEDKMQNQTRTLVTIQAMELKPLESNTFTKAFLEGKSR